jgi:hypothetical protein
VRTSITRRGFLRGLLGVTGAAGVSLAAGCDLLGGGEAQAPAPDPLLPFLADTTALLARYNLALVQAPPLATVITNVRDAHREHAVALAKAINGPTPGASATASGGPAGDRGTVLAALVEAETKARDAAIEACLNTTPRLAPLLGSIAAARATHLEILR